MNRLRTLTTPFAALVVAAGCATAPTSSDVARSIEDTHPQCGVHRESKMVLGLTKLWAVRGLLNPSRASGAICNLQSAICNL